MGSLAGKLRQAGEGWLKVSERLLMLRCRQFLWILKTLESAHACRGPLCRLMRSRIAHMKGT